MTTSDQILVFGAGGHAKVVLAALLERGVRVAAVLDTDRARWGETILGQPIVDPESLDLAGRPAVLAIGDNATRSRLEAGLDCQWQPVVHPAATVHESAEIGAGAFIAAGAVVQPDAHIGAHAIVNTGATVDHDCRLGPFSHVAPGAHLAGGVVVGEGALVGVGALVAPYLEIGGWSVLGAGATAVRDIPRRAVAVGVPAKVRDDG